MLRCLGASPALTVLIPLVFLLIGTSNRATADETLFGIPLEAAKQSGTLGASRTGVPDGLTLTGGEATPGAQAATAASWDGAGHWYHARPLKLPKVLRDTSTELQVAVAEDHRLFWLLLRASVADCSATGRWLRDALSRKYAGAQWQPGPAADSQLLRTDTLKIALACNTSLSLEYLFPAVRDNAYEQQFDEESIFLRSKEERHRAYVRRLRLQYESRDWLRGSRTRIESYFGLQTMHGNAALEDGPADLEVSFQPQRVSSPFPAAAQHEITVDPEGRLIRLQSEASDPDRLLESHLLEHLEALFGEPYRRGRSSQRYRVGYQWLVLRHREQKTSLVYLNQRLQDQQKERARLAEAARFEADTEGL